MIYNENAVGGVLRVNPSKLIDTMTDSSIMGDMSALTSMSGIGGMSQMMSMYNLDAFTELNTLNSERYELLAGRMPEKFDELLIVTGENDDLSDLALFTLGLRDQGEVNRMFTGLMSGQVIETAEEISFSYDELLALTFRLVLPGDLYQPNAAGIYASVEDDPEKLGKVLEKGVPMRVVGIARSSSQSLISAFVAGGIGYTHALTEYVVNANNETAAVKAQKENPETDIFTGIRFDGGVDMEVSMELLDQYLATLPAAQAASIRAMISLMSEERILSMMKEQMAKQKTGA